MPAVQRKHKCWHGCLCLLQRKPLLLLDTAWNLRLLAALQLNLPSYIDPKLRFTWENTRNPGGWHGARFPWKKRTTGGVGLITSKVTITLKATNFMWENIRKVNPRNPATWNARRIFLGKHRDFRRVVGTVFIYNLQGLIITFLALAFIVDSTCWGWAGGMRTFPGLAGSDVKRINAVNAVYKNTGPQYGSRAL